jgi:hypothetical protein
MPPRASRHDCLHTCCCLHAYPASLPPRAPCLRALQNWVNVEPLSTPGRWPLLLLVPLDTQALVALAALANVAIVAIARTVDILAASLPSQSSQSSQSSLSSYPALAVQTRCLRKFSTTAFVVCVVQSRDITTALRSTLTPYPTKLLNHNYMYNLDAKPCDGATHCAE